MCPKTCGIARTPANRRMDPEILDSILSDVVPGISRIDLVGDGEILLEPAMLKTVLQAARKHRVLVNASTNAVLLNEQAAELLIEGELHDLNVSLDAATEITYRKIRGYDFKKIIANIETLNRRKAERKSDIPHLHFSMVGMKLNISELPALVDLAAECNAESVILQAMGEFDPVKNQSIYLRNRDIGRETVLQAREIGSKRRIRIELWPENQFDEVGIGNGSPDTDDISLRKDCFFPWDVPYFATDGSIRPCCAMPPLGNLQEQSFEAIWSGNRYTHLRKLMKSASPPEACQTCPGRGWHPPTIPAAHAQPGKNDTQYALGWFETEQDSGGVYKWARETASIFLAGTDAALLSLDLQTASDPGSTQQVYVQIDDEDLVPIPFEPGQRQRVYLPLIHPDLDLHHVRLTADPWCPARLIPGSRDPRKLTVKTYGAALLGSRCNAEFNLNIRLLGYGFPRAVDAFEKSFHVDLYLCFDKHPPTELLGFIHLFPVSSPAGKPFFPWAELKRKIAPSNHRFQSDFRFTTDVIAPRIQNLPIDVKIPFHQPKGTWVVMAGFCTETGKRIPVIRTRMPVYRHSVLMDRIELT